ncbi:alpha/beta fold hydrolase [Planomonospora venezuelensis]|uniref:Pimeloyl-ACP methyl ester carboxylesterase n=1 Tax=Planomonospora venezuelensis TaxID=1999 RepID=A0A841CU82_PLAVE|nr:alpha/beta hydrolase [Planomonospora venezuelensis]MBB5961391.1 pimeloyl-ACP methyl ester carboxylesterase [Planomonospora venezuelensis]GIN01866.1 alpha/beta hydrolase [Planomonospora venezuelensis]
MATTTSRDGTRIGFERTGAGPTLVLVDAAGGFREFGPMGSLAERLAGGFTVVTYDRRGRGESGDTQPYAVEREVEDLAAVIEEGGGTAFVHGFSSGAALALLGVAAGLPIPMISLLEPPIAPDEPPDEGELAAEIDALVAAGRRGDAVEHFHTSIGVPPEMTAGMRQAPFFPVLEGIAHTLAYDSRVTEAVSPATLRSVAVPALVVSSQSSDERLRGWAQGTAAALPQGRHLTLRGEWHGVSDDALAPALADFFLRGAA